MKAIVCFDSINTLVLPKYVNYFLNVSTKQCIHCFVVNFTDSDSGSIVWEFLDSQN